ncbi:MAG: PAS domain S-box protein [Candidatus Lokiarchaeota archaeon]|nr:PAS domain S-box protein [Candidatus Lokiarchaeota archaeon]
MEKNNDKERELRELEKRIKLFYEYAPLPYQSLDENIKILDVNQAWLDFFGYDKEEVIGMCFCEFLILESKELLKSRFAQFKEVGVIHDVEYEIVKKNGIHRIILVDGRVEYDKNGNFKQSFCFFKDITERKRAEEELKESEEKFRTLIENLPDTIYSSLPDETSTTLFLSNRWEDWTGIPVETYFKNPKLFFKTIHPDDHKETSKLYEEAIKHGKEFILNYRVKHKDTGKEIYIRDHGVPIKNYKGEIISYNGVMTNITDLRKAEQKLIESEEKYRSLFDNAQVGLYWSSISDGKFLECNETFAKLFGYNTREECLTSYIATEHYVNPHQRFEILEAIRSNKEVRGYEILVTKRDDTPIWLSISARMFEKENRVEGAAIDITKRKKAEQELKESEERYRKAYGKADFYKDLLAHDVSNIFNNINASVQLMKIWKDDYDVSSKERKMIEIIKQQLERGASLVSNVRKLSEIEEGEMLVKSIDAKKVLDKVIEGFRSRFHEREIEISFNTFQEITNVVGGVLLIDAFENLLINGVIHNDSEKIRLWINLSKVYQEDKNFVKIEFKDNGLGIIDGRKNPIFERNYKNDRSTGGMGIGLSLVKTIINSYGGQLWVENRVVGDYSQGSNFIILLKEG